MCKQFKSEIQKAPWSSDVLLESLSNAFMFYIDGAAPFVPGPFKSHRQLTFTALLDLEPNSAESETCKNYIKAQSFFPCSDLFRVLRLLKEAA